MELMPGYKQTTLGVIPGDWQLTCLGAHGETYGGLTGKTKKDFGTGEAQYVTFMNVIANVVIDCDVFDRVHVTPAESQNRVRKNDLLFNGSSETPEEVAFCAVHLGDFSELYLNSFCFGYRLRDQHAIDPLFLAYLFRSRTGRELVKALAQGSTRYNISKRALLGAPLALPPTPEQRAIAAALSDVDALLASLDQIITKKRDLKQAAMQQLLTGKTRLPGFGGEWETKPFSAVLNRLNAKSHQIQASEYQETGRFPVVDQGKDFVVGFSDREDKRFRCPDGGVIVFGDHTCIVKFIDFDFLVGADGTQILHGKHGQNTRFHALQLQYRGIETTGYNRHFKILKEREFFVPPLPEQDAIASALSSMDAELSVLEARRDKTFNLKQAMMQELLTGKTRLV